MSTTTQSPLGELQQRLAAAQAEKAEAESAIGAVVLDGGDERAARKRVEEASATVENLQLAITEQQYREEAAERERRKQREADARYRVIAWHREHMRRLAAMLDLQRQVDAAAAGLEALGSPDSGDVVGPEGSTAWVSGEIEAGRLPTLTCYSNRPISGGMEHRSSIRRYIEEMERLDPAEHAKVLDTELKKLGKSVDTRSVALPWEAK